jgi:hypothetical protein
VWVRSGMTLDNIMADLVVDWFEELALFDYIIKLISSRSCPASRMAPAICLQLPGSKRNHAHHSPRGSFSDTGRNAESRKLDHK